MAEPSAAQWVNQLESILREQYMPAIMDSIREKIGPLVAQVLEDYKPLIERWTQEEVERQLTKEALRRVKVTLET